MTKKGDEISFLAILGRMNEGIFEMMDLKDSCFISVKLIESHKPIHEDWTCLFIKNHKIK